MTINSISFRQSDTKEHKTEKRKSMNSATGTAAALVTGALVHQVAPQIVGFPAARMMQKFGTLNDNNGEKVHQAIKEMLKETKLDEKGVRIKFLNSQFKLPNNIEKLFSSMDEFILNFNNFVVKNGMNAYFLHGNEDKLPRNAKGQLLVNNNSVVLPKEKLHTAGFHELGHAMNCHFSKIGKLLQKCRPIAMFGPVLVGIYGAISTKSKAKEEGTELTNAQKTNNFVRDNAGKFAFGLSLPMLIEEAMASIKGQRFANKLLDKNLANRVLKTNLVAYSTYLLMGIAGALACTCAVKVKDSFVAKKENKYNEKDLDLENLNNVLEKRNFKLDAHQA